VQSWALVLELGLGVFLPLVLFALPRVRRHPTGQFVAAALVVLGVVVNRINVFLVAYNPPFATRPYFPSLYEVMLTTGLIATLVLVYRAAVMILPVLAASPPDRGEPVCDLPVGQSGEIGAPAAGKSALPPEASR
jgi:Ni/Fe-hydrogenase subunit HybB-like protein